MTEAKTLTFTRTLPATPDRVIAALTSVEDRTIWGTPSPDMALLIEDQPAAAPGVRETSHVGPVGTPYVTVFTDWIILDQDRVTYAETLEADGAAFATSLADFHLTQDGGNTALSLTVTVFSYAGEDAISEVAQGWTHAVNALSTHLDA
ncbi:hypothetical protein [Gymnodinialimonas sp. 57CJ19]|uniref:hypothetical protein n=1 Tax=Gymnodinialimonas sp. 57CJ19 TaxID=3138498 RepID=UPI00313423E8